MTQFINPVEILNLAGTDLTTIDDTLIKRARKAALAEIDLSDDGMLAYHDLQLTRADCERAIDELQEHDKLEFYHFIANNPALNNFLVSGEDAFFTGFRHESIYKLSEFLRFISPYFAAAYDGVLSKAWQRYGSPLDKYLAIEPIILPEHIDLAFQSIRNAINRQIADAQAAYTKVMDKAQEINIAAIAAQADILLDKDRLNILPPYFQDLRNSLAAIIRDLSVEINNARGDVYTAKELNLKLQEVKTDGVVKDTIMEDYEVYLKIETELEQQNDPQYVKWHAVSISLSQLAKAASNPQSSVAGVNIWIDQNINIAEINELNSKYNALRYSLAIRLSNLGAIMWKHHRDHATALRTIEMALQIEGLEKETTDLLTEAKIQLAADAQLPGSTANDPGGNNEKLLRQLIIIAAVIIVIMVLTKGCSR